MEEIPVPTTWEVESPINHGDKLPTSTGPPEAKDFQLHVALTLLFQALERSEVGPNHAVMM